MSDLTLIILAAGDSTRFNSPIKKQWLRIGHEPLWLFVANRFEKTEKFSNIIITASKNDVTFMHSYTQNKIVVGGSSRQASLKNALQYVDTPYVLVTDVARSCVSDAMLARVLDKKGEADCIVPSLHVSDTIVYDDDTVNRDKILRIQTPQLSRTDVLKKALDTDVEYTDESSAIVANGGTRLFVDGEDDAFKLTFANDLKELGCLKEPACITLVGNGFDVHAFDDKGEMFLCGVKIENSFGFKAHSDGDVAIHSLIDALLGAAGMGDIGMLFPDNDDKYKGIDSKLLLQDVVQRLYRFGYKIVNVDITIIAETPRIGAYKDAMRNTLSAILQIPSYYVNVKATTTEKLGFIGKKEGVGVMSSASLNYFNWTNK
ncbi:bifunctional 2-C-methyl-D-erythritol 4-phosphate cytidylyltransferase/2-C-methyl-D-erythritol 2,4-cyclodiphosphate synthase [bacterium]|nr:bifunctional 2-C-methyl-D-erythritol 4-phosphate cytidylyltransferase/2-C-methyl-D-erythritol 2,4-cyclodiphosphate synthase [bacterium]MBU1883824.1 bifunctional 2-C-methyl-D-erythritol 4-phosphate cytidylyltransferase/2-C-methyl-D-erythritol 2,4-cyclodiphosphate synthase [bacterium]